MQLTLDWGPSTSISSLPRLSVRHDNDVIVGEVRAGPVHRTEQECVVYLEPLHHQATLRTCWSPPFLRVRPGAVSRSVRLRVAPLHPSTSPPLHTALVQLTRRDLRGRYNQHRPSHSTTAGSSSHNSRISRLTLSLNTRLDETQDIQEIVISKCFHLGKLAVQCN